MEIQDINLNEAVDLFGLNTEPNTRKFNFKGEDDSTVDIFSPTDDTTTIPVTDDTTLPITDTTTVIEDADILGNSKDNKEGSEDQDETSTIDFSSYFKDGVEKGIFVPLTIENEKGEEVEFIPKSPEEFNEVIELQINHKLGEKEKEVETKFYSQKSPAWKAVFQYAELVDDPTEIIPFVQGIQQLQNINDINENEIEGAEKILRMEFEKKGQSKKLIDVQIESLKASNQIVEMAKEVKPQMLQEEAVRLQKMKQEEAIKLDNYKKLVMEIREGAIKSIEEPIGKSLLKTEEKSAIYDLIAAPDEQTGGYKIYEKIDKLFETKDFDTLRQLALLLTNKESYIKYITAPVKNEVAASLERKIRISTDSSRTLSKSQPTEAKVVKPQVQSSGTTKFGRG